MGLDEGRRVGRMRSTEVEHVVEHVRGALLKIIIENN
jgi:hypothetical protein